MRKKKYIYIYTLSKIAAPGWTSSASFEAVLSNKDESRISGMNVSENKANITTQFPVNLFPFQMIISLN